MSLSIGIVGLPNVGKSTLFNALTARSVAVENFPFCTIDPSVGVVAVPDPRLDKLAAFSHSAKKIPAAVEFVDIAGLVRGASEGEGLGNQFLSHIREVDALAHVVRVFDDEDIIHVSGRVEPLEDIEVINLELALADLETVTKRLENIARDAKRGDGEARAEVEVLALLERELREGRAARVLMERTFTPEQKKTAQDLHLLTAKPMLYVLNHKASVGDLGRAVDDRTRRLFDYFETTGSLHVTVDAGIESELRDLSADDALTFRREYGVLESGMDELIRAGYRLLNLITFFTTGEDETRAWTIPRGSTAPNAGAAIHSDFRDKFIRAEVIAWDTLLAAGSYAAARERGLLRTEGKTYVVVDGDVIEYKI